MASGSIAEDAGTVLLTIVAVPIEDVTNPIGQAVMSVFVLSWPFNVNDPVRIILSSFKFSNSSDDSENQSPGEPEN